MPKSAHSPEHVVLQRTLRQIRVESGLNQRKLAERLNTPQSFVSKYESGERRLDLIELDQITSALGITLAVLIRRYKEAINEAER